MTDERAIEDRIRARAHEIWEREGRPEGAHGRHWDEARLEVEAEERVAAAAAPERDVVEATEGRLAGTSGAPDVFPEAGTGAPPDEDLPLETEASPSQFDRAPM
ncbi:DUF2934 domain-containing protein [Amaricoccus solimangrovi]|uniref:DUF2934 domain-containing protein n=1 Tax=Amaricoccus solimangrovi TaxID=2589815 RepID=A0A501WXH0_9RHOB|nr:DUF2934 domain-containing protein [Amaricoccus solimangrovi]TPE52945.1 DUF2934 domain-containing protein [Amaricoccus solimangrovi]